MRHAGRFVTVGGKATRPRRFPLGHWRWVAFAGLSVYVIFAIVVVLGGLALRSVTVLLTPLMPIWDLFTWANYEVIATYPRSEEHTSELQSLMRSSYAVFCLKKKKKQIKHHCLNEMSTYRLHKVISR